MNSFFAEGVSCNSDDVLNPNVVGGVSFEDKKLTLGQKSFWHLYCLDPRRLVYNLNYAWHVRSPINWEIFKRTLEEMVQRHPFWRSVFLDVDNDVVQRVYEYMPLSYEEVHVDFSDSDLQAELWKEAYRKFDLGKEPPIRWKVFHRAGKDPILHVLTHHIATDLKSFVRSLNEISIIYHSFSSGKPHPLKPLEVCNEDFVAWQEKLFAGEKMKREGRFWLNFLKDERPVLNMPLDKPRPALSSFNGSCMTFNIPDSTKEAVLKASKSANSSLYNYYLSVYQILLHRYTGQNDILVGTPTIGRRGAFSSLIGYYANPVVLRSKLETPLSFKSLLGRNKAQVIKVLSNADYPFPLLVQNLKVASDPSRAPVFQTSFV